MSGRSGDPTSPPSFGDDWLGVVYDDLRRIAAAHLARERSGHTLRATDLVHEAWLRFRGYDSITLKGRGHFLALASQAMRRVLVDHARRRGATKRTAIAIELCDQLESLSGEDLIHLDDALSRFARIDPDSAKMLELRYFAGASAIEIGQAFDLAERTVRNRLAYARSWLRDALDT